MKIDLNNPHQYVVFLIVMIFILFMGSELVRYMYQHQVFLTDEDIIKELESDKTNHLAKLRRHLKEGHIKDPELRKRLEKFLQESENISAL